MPEVCFCVYFFFGLDQCMDSWCGTNLDWGFGFFFSPVRSRDFFRFQIFLSLKVFSNSSHFPTDLVCMTLIVASTPRCGGGPRPHK